MAKNGNANKPQRWQTNVSDKSQRSQLSTVTGVNADKDVINRIKIQLIYVFMPFNYLSFYFRIFFPSGSQLKHKIHFFN